MTCRICLDPEPPLVSACACSGTCEFVHQECVQKWVDVSGARKCELCLTPYKKGLVTFPKRRRCRSPNPITDNEMVGLSTFVGICAMIHGISIVVETWRGYGTNLNLSVLCLLFSVLHICLWGIMAEQNKSPERISAIWLVSFSVTILSTSYALGTPWSVPFRLACYLNAVVSLLGMIVPRMSACS